MARSRESLNRQKEKSREWKKANPERHAELARAYRERNRLKTRAQNQLNYAIRKGTVERQPCEACGTTERVHAHHDDYSKPLDVRWLCLVCHKAAHPVSETDKEVKVDDAKHASLRGEQSTSSILTAKQVSEIRKLLDVGIAQQKIAALYGVHQTHISRIKRGKAWQDVL